MNNPFAAIVILPHMQHPTSMNGYVGTFQKRYQATERLNQAIKGGALHYKGKIFVLDPVKILGQSTEVDEDLFQEDQTHLSDGSLKIIRAHLWAFSENVVGNHVNIQKV